MIVARGAQPQLHVNRYFGSMAYNTELKSGSSYSVVLTNKPHRIIMMIKVSYG